MGKVAEYAFENGVVEIHDDACDGLSPDELTWREQRMWQIAEEILVQGARGAAPDSQDDKKT